MSAAAGSKGRELVLVDGNSLAYRAFFALPDTIATSKGMVTNALFGFASMLVKLVTDHGVRPTIVAWDAGWSGREVEYSAYKAQRRSRPDLLKEQWPWFDPLVEAFGYANVKCPGIEADDVIATLAERARERGAEVLVVTGDRDALQLVGDGVKVMTTSRGITDTKVYDREAVIERYGIPPELVPDFIGLKGDTSDNIPGVPGIGDKTAAQLLQEFGDLEGVLANVDSISGAKRKQNLVEHAEAARISKRLATAMRAVDLELDLDAVIAQEPDRSKLRELFRELELRSPLERLEEALGAAKAAPGEQIEAQVVLRKRAASPADLASLKAELVTLVARRPVVDQPTLEGLEAEGAALRFAAWDGGGEVLSGEASSLDELAAALPGPVVVHDWKSLAAAERDAAPPPLGHDTMVAAYLLDPNRRAYPISELAAEAGLAAKVEGGDDLAEEAVLMRMLAALQLEQLEKQGLEPLYREIEQPLVQVLLDMERAGVKLDPGQLAVMSKRIGQQVAELEADVYRLAGREFTIGSPQQLAQVLFEELGLSKRRRGKTGFSTDARVLASIRDEHEIIPKVEAWRELSKLRSTYLDALPALIDPRDGRLHTTFNQVAASTGRLSSVNPNLQNIPIRTEVGREIRAAFVAEPGCVLTSADYGQIELRILAHVAGEETLRDILRGGGDVHSETAAQIFGLDPSEVDAGIRSKAKMVNFGIAYGLSAFGLADRLQIPQDEAQEFIDRYFARFPKLAEFRDATIADATQKGYVTTLLGRIRHVPELRIRQRQQRMLGERLAVNAIIQGTAADIMKIGMLRSTAALREKGLSARLVLQIHDELLFEGPAEEAGRVEEIVCRELAGALALDPPLAVDAGSGPSWLEAK